MRAWPEETDWETVLKDAGHALERIKMSSGVQLISAQEVAEEPTWHMLAATLLVNENAVRSSEQRFTRPAQIERS